jgi:chemotaxis protein CheY-P-specific phosphatase CheC
MSIGVISIYDVVEGSGESGKSTFVKQMRIIHGKGYSEEDRLEFRTPVIQNIVSSIQTTLQAMTRMDIKLTSPSLEVQAKKVLAADRFTMTKLTQDLVEAIEQLWADPGLQQCVNRRREFQLSDSTEYYMSHIRRIGAQHYIPNLTDVLRVRVPTTGVIEYPFQMDDKIVFRSDSSYVQAIFTTE